MQLPHAVKRTILSSLGGTIELYDFVIFALFSPMIATAFFPLESELARLLGAYAVFAIGYFIRPFGGIVFSHFGDKHGRKHVFSITIALMAMATLLMSIIPSYQFAGISSTIAFIGLRLIQGLAISGEIPGALTYVSEHTKDKGGLACGLIIAFLNIGILLANTVYHLLSVYLSENVFLIYGWRIAFALGGIAAFISLIFRKALDETPMFNQLAIRSRLPLIREHKKIVVASIIITGLAAMLVSLYLLFLPSYLQTVLGLNPVLVGRISLMQLLLFTIFSPLYSYLSDYINGHRLLSMACVVIALFSVIFFKAIINTHHYYLLVAVNALVIASFMGGYAVFLTKLFPTKVRYSGMALSYNIGFALFGGLTPFLATLLIHQLHWSASPSILVVVSSLLALIGLTMVGYSRPLCESNKSAVLA